MRGRVLTTAVIALTFCVEGCGTSTRRPQPDQFSPVAVRFTNPPESAMAAQFGVEGEAKLTGDPASPGQTTGTGSGQTTGGTAGQTTGGASGRTTTGGTSPQGESNLPTPITGDSHVALWGNGFDGADVTGGVASLPPGSYTFAFFNDQQRSVYQGWLDVSHENDDLVDYLMKWKAGIPEQKRQLAYEFEASGNNTRSDLEALKGFRAQVQALDELERHLNAAIRTESAALRRSRQQNEELLRNAEVLLLPGGGSVFYFTTDAAFTPQDINTVTEGGAVTKFVLVADHNAAMWKTRRVNQLFGDLMRCRTVMKEEADRMERRKGLMLLTQHLHNNDAAFMANEYRLQTALGAIDRIDDQINDVRQRRMALAFVSELISADGKFDALSQEESELMQEKAVADAYRNHLDQMCADSSNISSRRVAFEHARQRAAAWQAKVDTQLNTLQQARTVLASMVGNTNVIHRQGDTRMITAALAGSGLPLSVRQAIENEAVMCVRLQKGDEAFVPVLGGLAASPAGGVRFEPTWTSSGQSRVRVVSDRTRTWQGRSRSGPAGGGKPLFEGDCPWYVKMLVPPCWIAPKLQERAAGNYQTRTYSASVTAGEPDESEARLVNDAEPIQFENQNTDEPVEPETGDEPN